MPRVLDDAVQPMKPIRTLATLVLLPAAAFAHQLDARVAWQQSVATNASTYKTFGAGCKGSFKGQPNCASNNANGGTLSRSVAPNEFAYQVKTTSALQVSGFSIYTYSLGGNPTVRTAIYKEGFFGVPAPTPIATGTMTVGAKPGFYRTNIHASLPAGTYYLGVDHSARSTYLSQLTSGTRGTVFWRRPPTTGAWILWNVVTRPSFIVHCDSPSGIPQLGNVGVPELNRSFELNLHSAKANSPALLVFGVSNTTWNSITLPLDLTVVNAPGCKLYVSLEVHLKLTTSGTGFYSKRKRPVIPSETNPADAPRWVYRRGTRP